MNIAQGSPTADAFARATALHQSGKLAEAERLYRAVLATQPNHAQAHYGLGVALIGLGRLPLAAAHFRTAIALAPKYADSAHNLGCIDFLLNRPEAALAWFDATLAIAPDHAGAHYNRGGALMEIGRIDEARASVERALALTPERASYYRCLGELKRFTADDPHLAAMERLAAKVETLAVDVRWPPYFGHMDKRESRSNKWQNHRSRTWARFARSTILNSRRRLPLRP